MALVTVTNASKLFRQRKRRLTIREHLQESVAKDVPADAFRALKGITFSIEQRESVAIVGANGAGKSTLLGLACGLAQPDEGSVTIDTTIAPLLELGSGFHYDLTGRENVFMNAALLGMTRVQANERFQSIVDFSELGDAIEEPVRVYSAGMVMRLAFSVAVHCDASLFVIDEVLGVGDASYSKKCLNKIRELRANGKSLLFVSHNPGSVVEFCDRVIWLHEGEMVMDGPAPGVMERYMEFMAHPGSLLPGNEPVPAAARGGQGELDRSVGKSSHRRK